jgi:hypothetical protein
MSGIEHYCPKAGPIFISALLLQRSRVEHYADINIGPALGQLCSTLEICNNQADINIGPALGQ